MYAFALSASRIYRTALAPYFAPFDATSAPEDRAGGSLSPLPIEVELIRNSRFLKHPGELCSKVVHVVAQLHDSNDPLNLVVDLLPSELL
jgi:hypothetical protein